MYGSPGAGLARRLVAIGAGALAADAAIAGVPVGLGPLTPARAAVQARSTFPWQILRINAGSRSSHLDFAGKFRHASRDQAILAGLAAVRQGG